MNFQDEYKPKLSLNMNEFGALCNSERHFANRVCATWNNLPKAVVEATSIDMFKGRLDNYLRLNLGMK